ncbi:hypothetical protein CEXT_321391 [Caerostris extrusa]|uniref:Metallothionein n=1 Tax=Caerostris extrusa TaxID=172846 RepID=A0AAV4NQS7_CAEEX|nr:hypothetical protein CEXT_321391 [Caerostris extrusa]
MVHCPDQTLEPPMEITFFKFVKSTFSQCAHGLIFCPCSGYHLDSEECEHCQKCFCPCDMQCEPASSKATDGII